MSSITTLASSDLFPVRSVPFNSARDTGTGRSPCFIGSNQPSEDISVCLHNSFLVSVLCVFNHILQSGKCWGVILAHRLVD